MSLQPQSRVGDDAKCDECGHDNSCCKHKVKGPGTEGAKHTKVNGKAALIVGSKGKHEDKCCGENKWKVTEGCKHLKIEGKPAAHKGHKTKHCGGEGKLVKGSPNVKTGN